MICIIKIDIYKTEYKLIHMYILYKSEKKKRKKLTR